MDFTGKNVIVTGGANGIGRAVVDGIVAGGGKAIIVDINLDAARGVADELGNSSVFPYKVDLSNPDEIRNVFTQIINDMGQVHVLINSAGIVSTKPFEEITQAEWDRVIAIDLTALFVCCSAVYPHMVGNAYGRIVNISSVAAKLGGGLLGTSAYATAKAGVNGLTKAIAREGAAKGVACNAVCPSLTFTSMISENTSDEKIELIKAAIPMKRGAQPKEIANVVLFYASDLASFVTGEISDVDGGLTRDG
ncbi:MAG: SDR family oxidoreductase [Defluviitaleaceae bacterium]|nr:SDR family oxidoreductase [Defluviitaleaceae bacterium]